MYATTTRLIALLLQKQRVDSRSDQPLLLICSKGRVGVQQIMSYIQHYHYKYCVKGAFHSIPHFSASLDCRKQGSYQILVEQSFWRIKNIMSKSGEHVDCLVLQLLLLPLRTVQGTKHCSGAATLPNQTAEQAHRIYMLEALNC